MQSSDSLINTESSLKIYFHDALARESEKNQLEITEHTHWYLTNLLDTFSRSEKFFDYQPDRGTLTPLADYYQRAVEAESTHEKRLHLQRLGSQRGLSSLGHRILHRAQECSGGPIFAIAQRT